MQRWLLALALVVGLGALPAAPVAATGPDADTLDALDALILVGESDLAALLESGHVGEHTLLSPAEVGLDEAALTGAGQFSPDALLSPRDLGLDVSANYWMASGGLAPFFRGFWHRPRRGPLPIFFWRPPVPPLPPVAPFPIFPRVGVVVLPSPPPLVLPVAPPPPPLPPPAPLAPRAPRTAPVPIIPEADSLALVGLGLAGLVAAAWWRRRHGSDA